MTRSASTPRLQATLLFYLLLMAVTAVAGPPRFGALANLLVSVAALLLVGFAVLGRIWCSVFIAGRKDAELVVEGPYSLCRHPLYTLSLIGGLGLGLATHSWLLTLATLAFLTVMFTTAARAEERLLGSLHGAAYERYRDTTPRFVPRGSWSTAPEHVQVRATVLWKAFLDGGSFIVLLAMIETARTLRENGILPQLLSLP